jgi:tRNA(Ile2) C34 agmatinyltransferase TiaS
MRKYIDVGEYRFLGIKKITDLLEGQTCPKCEKDTVEALDLFGCGIAFRCSDCKTLYDLKYNYELHCHDSNTTYYEVIKS